MPSSADNRNALASAGEQEIRDGEDSRIVEGSVADGVSVDDQVSQHPLVRPASPSDLSKQTSHDAVVALATGLYGSRGERLRHIALKDALRLDTAALSVMLRNQPQLMDLSSKTSDLPEINSVLPPSVDPPFPNSSRTETAQVNNSQPTDCLNVASKDSKAPKDVANSSPTEYIVTEVFGEWSSSQATPPSQPVRIWTTRARNRSHPVEPSNTSVSGEALPERIRGGGEGDTNNPAGQANNLSSLSGAQNLPTSASGSNRAGSSNLSQMVPGVLQQQQLRAMSSALGTATVGGGTIGSIGISSSSNTTLPAPSGSNSVNSSSMATSTNVLAAAKRQPHAPVLPAGLGPPHPLLSVSQTPPVASTAPPPTNPSYTVSSSTSLSGTEVRPVAAPVPSTVASSSSVAAPQPAQASAVQEPPRVVPTTTTSETTAKPTAPASLATGSIVKSALVVALPSRPDPQWVQHTPGANDELVAQADPANKLPYPDWFSPTSVSDLERTLLPEWFDGSARHRTPERYLQARQSMMHISRDKWKTRYLTATMARKSIPGDAGSLIRLHKFLTSYALINEDAWNDSAPTPAALQKPQTKASSTKAPVQWTTGRRRELVEAVVYHARKRQKVKEETIEEQQRPSSIVDWQLVAEQVGDGVTAQECEKQFLTLQMPSETDTKGDTAILGDSNVVSDQEEWVQDLVELSDPNVVHAATMAALNSSWNAAKRGENSEVHATDTISNERDWLSKGKRAAVVALALTSAVNEARSQEETFGRLLAEVVDLRMKKLENRLALLDDVEGLLEAERVALELERRDLYTARCRNWFGGP